MGKLPTKQITGIWQWLSFLNLKVHICNLLKVSFSKAFVSPFQAAHHPRSHKSVMFYSLFNNVCHTKIYPGVLNISLSISIAHQSIDTVSRNSVFVTFTIHKKNWTKKSASSGTWTRGLQPASPVSTCCAITITKA